jgi:hypothetical protein
MLVMDGLDLFTFKREILEFLLGLGMLIAVVVIANGFRGRFVSRRAVPVVVLTWAGVIVLGAATASVSGTNRSADPRSVEVARVELSALGRDFLSRVQPTVCGMHQRIHRYAQHFSAFFLFKGEFAKLTDSGLPAERAQFFLDPWNSPYWVLDECTSGGDRFVIVYSFGPNRRRDSSQAGQLRGDDVGAVIFDGSPPADWSIPGQSTPEGTKPAFPRPVKGDP